MKSNTKVDGLAQVLWNYLKLDMPLEKCDLILAFGSHDTSVVERAVEVYEQGFGQKIMFSGGLGRLTRVEFNEPEARIFANLAIQKGVPKEDIIIEDKSTNSGENIKFSFQKLQEKHINPESILVIHKPYMERRAWAAIKKQWPNPQTEFFVSSPNISFADYCKIIPKEKVINTMVGDLQRIKEYPSLGFQITQDIPSKVWQAWRTLVDLGFNEQLIKSRS